MYSFPVFMQAVGLIAGGVALVKYCLEYDEKRVKEMIIKTTKYNYGALLLHHPELGLVFTGSPQTGSAEHESRWVYPVMVISSGEFYEVEPHELIGCLIIDHVALSFKKEVLK